MLAPFGANAAGWIFTEMGRQPFVVAPNPSFEGIDQVFMFTAAAVSPGVSAGEMLFSLITLTSIYAVLLVVEVVLLTRYIRGGVGSAMPELPRPRRRRRRQGRRCAVLRLLTRQPTRDKDSYSWISYPPCGSS